MPFSFLSIETALGSVVEENDKLEEIGENASLFAKREFNRDHLINKLEDHFKQATSKK